MVLSNLVTQSADALLPKFELHWNVATKLSLFILFTDMFYVHIQSSEWVVIVHAYHEHKLLCKPVLSPEQVDKDKFFNLIKKGWVDWI